METNTHFLEVQLLRKNCKEQKEAKAMPAKYNIASTELIEAAQEEAQDWVAQNSKFSDMSFIAKRTIAEFILNRNGYTMFKNNGPVA